MLFYVKFNMAKHEILSKIKQAIVGSSEAGPLHRIMSVGGIASSAFFSGVLGYATLNPDTSRLVNGPLVDQARLITGALSILSVAVLGIIPAANLGAGQIESSHVNTGGKNFIKPVETGKYDKYIESLDKKPNQIH